MTDPNAQPPAPAMTDAEMYPPEDIEPGKMFAILGYIVNPLWVIPLVQKDNAFSLYHAKQAMVLSILSFASIIVIMVISIVTCGIGSFLYLAFFVLLYPWIMGIVNASQGKYEPLPWIGGLADKYFAGIIADKRPGTPVS